MTIEQQLTKLRQDWLDAKKRGDTKGMKLIEIRGKLLKISGPPRLDEITEDIIKEIFL